MALFTVGIDAAYRVGGALGATDLYADYEAENAEEAKQKALAALRKEIAEDEEVPVHQVKLYDVHVSIEEA